VGGANKGTYSRERQSQEGIQLAPSQDGRVLAHHQKERGNLGQVARVTPQSTRRNQYLIPKQLRCDRFSSRKRNRSCSSLLGIRYGSWSQL